MLGEVVDWAADLEVAAGRLTADPDHAARAMTLARAIRSAPAGADGWAWLAARGDAVAAAVVRARDLRAPR